MKKVFLSIINVFFLVQFPQSSFAEVEGVRTFKSKKGNTSFELLVNSSDTCKKNGEVIKYHVFRAYKPNTMGCALTYHYLNRVGARSSFLTDKVVIRSQEDLDVCWKKKEKLLKKVKSLGFQCEFSGFG